MTRDLNRVKIISLFRADPYYTGNDYLAFHAFKTLTLTGGYKSIVAMEFVEVSRS